LLQTTACIAHVVVYSESDATCLFKCCCNLSNITQIDSFGLIKFGSSMAAVPNAASAKSYFYQRGRPGTMSGTTTAIGAAVALFWSEALDIYNGGTVYAGNLSNTSYAVVFSDIALKHTTKGNAETFRTITAELLIDACGSITLTYPAIAQPPDYDMVYIGAQSSDANINAVAASIIYIGTGELVDGSEGTLFTGELQQAIIRLTPAVNTCASLPVNAYMADNALYSNDNVKAQYEPALGLV
jgi:hypothetical protein